MSEKLFHVFLKGSATAIVFPAYSVKQDNAVISGLSNALIFVDQDDSVVGAFKLDEVAGYFSEPNDSASTD